MANPTSDITDADVSLRPLLRLRQVGRDIQRAAARGDYELAAQASGLLAPALADWIEARRHLDARDARIVRLSEETQSLLAQCEQTVQSAMNQTQERQNTVRQHQRRLKGLKSVRARQHVLAGHRLDARR